jgi:hypothetical protein
MKNILMFITLFVLSLNSFAEETTKFKVYGHQFAVSTGDILYDAKLSEEVFVSTLKKYFPESNKFKMRNEVYKELDETLDRQRKLIKEFLILTDNFKGMVKEEEAAPFYNAHEALKSIKSFGEFQSLMGYKGDKISNENYSKYRNASLALEALSLWKINFKK